MPLVTGQVLNNRYRVVKLLGQGGFGAVYKAWDTNLNSPCAVKENLDTSSNAQRMFYKEASILNMLKHYNLPRVTDYFFIQGQGQYLVMDYVEGEDIQAKIDKVGGPLQEQLVLPWIEQICDALSYLHSQNPPIIHRDIKPANIRITSQGQAMLVDFGIAKVYDPAVNTTIGARAITPGYSPNEQYGSGGRTDTRTDVYALGATLYTLLTGYVPPETPDRNLGVSLTAPRQLNPSISQQTEGVILRAMEMLPENRFQSISEFSDKLLNPAVAVTTPQSIPSTVKVPQSQGPASPVAPPMSHPPASSLGRKPRYAWFVLTALLIATLYLIIANNNGNWPFNAASEIIPPTIETALLATEVAPAVGSVSTSSPTFTVATLQSEPTITPSIENTLSISSPSPSKPPDGAQLGDTWIRPADKMLMNFIPSGEFLMGSTNSDPYADDDEKPQHTVFLDDYWIDRTEVTNSMFDLFTQATGYQTTAEKEGSGIVFNVSTMSWEDMAGADWRHPMGLSSSLVGLDDHPVVQVSWYDAIAYCTWAGGRLPTEAEWEKAARGSDGRIYPWENQLMTGNLMNFCDKNCPGDWKDENIDDGYAYTSPIGNYPSGASPFGLMDTVGNAWEWVNDLYGKTYFANSPSINPTGPSSGTEHVIRGGSWDYSSKIARIAVRVQCEPYYRSGIGSFRCAYSP